MPLYFNITGPCQPQMHYMLPPAARLVGAHLDRYVRDRLYWVLHAPRQTGKTTFLQSWMRELNAAGAVAACYVSVETCQEVTETDRAMAAVCDAIRQWAETFGLPMPAMPTAAGESMLRDVLHDWAALVAPKPLVVLFDEVDVIAGPPLVSFLRQLRSGFAGRDIGKFPVSVALVGMRDLRDYLLRSKDGVQLNPGSPFNIKQDSASLSNFSRADISALAAQHTAATGQCFAESALERIWQLTSGQPWLVNALLDKCVTDIIPITAATVPSIETEHVEQARELLIKSRATHIDALGQRLHEPRVRRVVQPIITGDSDPLLADGDDFVFCQDLGLVAIGADGSPCIANAIYREVLARELSYGMQLAIPSPEFTWRLPDGTLDMDSLLREFQTFWAWNADTWEAKADYTEAFPHLLLMAFLQRVTNGGGRIEREYAAGRGRLDLMLCFAGRKHAVEIKLVHPRMGREMTLSKGLTQIGRYDDAVQADTRHLVIFDRRPEARAKPWEERLSRDATLTTPAGRPVTVVWC